MTAENRNRRGWLTKEALAEGLREQASINVWPAGYRTPTQVTHELYQQDSSGVPMYAVDETRRRGGELVARQHRVFSELTEARSHFHSLKQGARA